jgi:hypothetical protein
MALAAVCAEGTQPADGNNFWPGPSGFNCGKRSVRNTLYHGESINTNCFNASHRSISQEQLQRLIRKPKQGSGLLEQSP